MLYTINYTAPILFATYVACFFSGLATGVAIQILHHVRDIHTIADRREAVLDDRAG